MDSMEDSSNGNEKRKLAETDLETAERSDKKVCIEVPTETTCASEASSSSADTSKDPTSTTLELESQVNLEVEKKKSNMSSDDVNKTSLSKVSETADSTNQVEPQAKVIQLKQVALVSNMYDSDSSDETSLNAQTPAAVTSTSLQDLHVGVASTAPLKETGDDSSTSCKKSLEDVPSNMHKEADVISSSVHTTGSVRDSEETVSSTSKDSELQYSPAALHKEQKVIGLTAGAVPTDDKSSAMPSNELSHGKPIIKEATLVQNLEEKATKVMDSHSKTSVDEVLANENIIDKTNDTIDNPPDYKGNEKISPSMVKSDSNSLKESKPEPLEGKTENDFNKSADSLRVIVSSAKENNSVITSAKSDKTDEDKDGKNDVPMICSGEVCIDSKAIELANSKTDSKTTSTVATDIKYSSESDSKTAVESNTQSRIKVDTSNIYARSEEKVDTVSEGKSDTAGQNNLTKISSGDDCLTRSEALTENKAGSPCKIDHKGDKIVMQSKTSESISSSVISSMLNTETEDKNKKEGSKETANTIGDNVDAAKAESAAKIIREDSMEIPTQKEDSFDAASKVEDTITTTHKKLDSTSTDTDIKSCSNQTGSLQADSAVATTFSDALRKPSSDENVKDEPMDVEVTTAETSTNGKDIPMLIGKPDRPSSFSTPEASAAEKEQTVEERLKSLYLPALATATSDKPESKILEKGKDSALPGYQSELPLIQGSKIESSSFVPLPSEIMDETVASPPQREPETSLDKKSEVSAMETESLNIKSILVTPAEGSLVNTPYNSGETSPATSTPVESCQVSAAPSPLPKEDTNLASESLLHDESSVDVREDGMEEKDQERPPVKRRRGRGVRSKKPKPKPKAPVIVDEDTRMSAANSVCDLGIDEDSRSSIGASSVKRETAKKYRSEVIVPESAGLFTADRVFEYLWPLEGIGEHYFIQEHIAQYLGITSFKRKYPDMRRRPLENQEKEYLKDLRLVTELSCDLGLTAVRSEDMLDIMFSDFPAKYEELQKVLRENKEKQLKEKGKVEYQVLDLDKSKMQEYARKAALNAAKWNASFNRDRHDDRRYSFDLQTFTLHLPQSRSAKLPAEATKMGSYPVAVLPGQYTDFCKKFSANELRGMPLQTVLLGPFTADELAAELQGEDSDDESGVASLDTCTDIKEEPEVAPALDPVSEEQQPICKVCSGGRSKNKEGKPEPLIICGTCRTAGHPTCIDLTLAMIEKIESYSWQCMECKTCAQCNDPDDEERMIFCDMCDRGYHIYCVGLRRVPNGRWHCKECAVCNTCGARNPAGNEHIKNAEWQHEFRKDKNNKQLKYTCTLCVPCDKYWKRRQFCSVCLKVYRSIPEDGMVRCSGCPKYVHKDKCSILHDNERYCNVCFKSRNKTALNHSRIIAAAKKKMATGSTLWK